MLPYSIIMSEKELKRLSDGQIEFYTSFPILIQDNKREMLQKCLQSIAGKKMYEEEFFKKPLETLQQLVDEPQGLLEQLKVILSSFQALLEKLEVDIAMVEKEQQKVTEMLLDYICEVHKNLGKIDRNSTITIRERSIKMLKISPCNG